MDTKGNYGKVWNMQEELIVEKTDELLQEITCPQEVRQQLKKFIVEIVSCYMILPRQRSIYKILTQKEGKCERTLLTYATHALEAIILDQQTRETLKRLGIRHNITAAKVLKAMAKEVRESVQIEKQNGYWIGEPR